MIKISRPKYAMIAGTEMRWDGQKYWRDAGLWGIGTKVVNGVILTDTRIHPGRGFKYLNNRSIKEITEEEYKKANQGYL